MSDNRKLQDMYRRTVLEHSRHPRNFRRLDAPDRIAEGFNPLCGDKITVYLDLGQKSIQAIAFEGTGCAISLASVIAASSSCAQNSSSLMYSSKQVTEHRGSGVVEI